MNDTQTLIELGVEIEGLLRVADARDSADARRLIAEKFAAYSALMHSFLEGVEGEPEELVKPEEPEKLENLEIIEDFEEPEARLEPEPEPTAPEPEPEPEPEELEEPDVPEPDPEPESQPAAVSADLRKAFTLNDKFRFTREVFGGDERDFDDTLEVLSEMESFREARDYIVQDLMLDPDDAAVADFLDVLARCF